MLPVIASVCRHERSFAAISWLNFFLCYHHPSGKVFIVVDSLLPNKLVPNPGLKVRLLIIFFNFFNFGRIFLNESAPFHFFFKHLAFTNIVRSILRDCIVTFCIIAIDFFRLFSRLRCGGLLSFNWKLPKNCTEAELGKEVEYCADYPSCDCILTSLILGVRVVHKIVDWVKDIEEYNTDHVESESCWVNRKYRNIDLSFVAVLAQDLFYVKYCVA